MKTKIDFAILKTGLLDRDFDKLCQEGADFRGLCVYPHRAYRASLMVPNTKIISVIGFPSGASQVKFEEAVRVVEYSDELDVVWNLDDFINGRYLTIVKSLAAIVNLGLPVKVIVPGLEYLGFEKIQFAYRIVQNSGAFCIKTLTNDPTLNFFLLECWKEMSGLKIKVAGGIDNYNLAKALLDVGADFIGTSQGVKIIEEEKKCQQ